MLNPRIWCLLADETEYWRDDYQAAAGRLIGIYLYDEREITHLCEFIGSYCCWHVETTTHRHVTDEMWENIRDADADGPGVEYRHTYQVDACLEIKQGDKFPDGMKMARFFLWELTDEEWAECKEENPEEPRRVAMDEALEYARGNSLY